MASIEPFIHRKLLVLHQETPARRAARAMCDQNVGCVIVADLKGELVGIVTDRDLGCTLASSPQGFDTPISEIMTPRPVSVESSADLEQVIRVMEDSGIRRMPVVERTPSGGSKCVGLITLDDLIVSQMIDYDHLKRLVRAQIKRKWVKRYWKGTDAPIENRSEAHRQQTINHFYHVISDRVRVSSESLVPMTRFLLGCLIQRVHYTAAANFIAQLPHDIQDELLDLPSGPNRKITPEYMARELAARFGYSDATTSSTLRTFFHTLSNLVNEPEIENITAQLPDDFRLLFKGEGPRGHGETAA